MARSSLIAHGFRIARGRLTGRAESDRALLVSASDAGRSGRRVHVLSTAAGGKTFCTVATPAYVSPRARLTFTDGLPLVHGQALEVGQRSARMCRADVPSALHDIDASRRRSVQRTTLRDEPGTRCQPGDRRSVSLPKGSAEEVLPAWRHGRAAETARQASAAHCHAHGSLVASMRYRACKEGPCGTKPHPGARVHVAVVRCAATRGQRVLKGKPWSLHEGLPLCTWRSRSAACVMQRMVVR